MGPGCFNDMSTQTRYADGNKDVYIHFGCEYMVMMTLC